MNHKNEPETYPLSPEMAARVTSIPYKTRFQMLDETEHMDDRQIKSYCKKHGITVDILEFWKDYRLIFENRVAYLRAMRRKRR